MNNIVRTKTKTRSPSLTARRQDLPIEVTSDQPLVARPNNLPGMGRTNDQLMAGMNDTPLDGPSGRREVEQPVTTMPAVISKALSTSRQGVKAFQMGNIISQWPTRQRAQLERAGRDLFSQQSERKLTMADIFTVSSLTNSETEVKKMAAWVCRHCVPKQRDIQYSFPSASGYQPKAEVWDGDGVRFLLVRETPRDFGEDIDPEGDVGGRNLFYIYGWNEPSANAHRLGFEDRKALTESRRGTERRVRDVRKMSDVALKKEHTKLLPAFQKVQKLLADKKTYTDGTARYQDVHEKVMPKSDFDRMQSILSEISRRLDLEKSRRNHDEFLSARLNEAIEPDAKDKERAEKLYYSSAKINAMAKAIKDPEKALRRGVAFSRSDINYYEAGLFRVRAEELGATEDQLAEFDALEKDARVERSRKFQDEENKKRKAMADAIPAGLVKSIGGDRKVSILWRSRRKVGRISSQYTMSNDFNGEAYYFTPAGSDQQLWLGDNFHTIGLSRYEAEIKLIKEFQIKPVLNEAAESDPMGKTFICVGEGRVEIIEGAEAMSADALEGNRFIVNPNYRGGEDEYRFYGKLDIGRNTFKVDPGLSGKTRLETNVDFGRVVYAIQKQTIDAEPSDFWATWNET